MEWGRRWGIAPSLRQSDSIFNYMSADHSSTRPRQHNGGFPPNDAEEIYWNSSKSAANITWPLQLSRRTHDWVNYAQASATCSSKNAPGHCGPGRFRFRRHATLSIDGLFAGLLQLP